ncbi:hypothetical protein [Citrobacter freundii complex sp. 2024EL-00220]
MMSLWDALRMNMMISYQELVRTFPKASVANTLLKAITALEQTQDNKQVVKELHSSLALLTGNKPISDIIWFPTPE